MKNKVLKKLFAISTAMLMIFNTGMSNISMVYANEGINETTVQTQKEEQSVEPVEPTEVNTGDAQVVGTPEDSNSSNEQATKENLGNEPNEVTQEDLDAKGIPAKVVSQNDNSIVLELYPGATMKDVYYRSANTRSVNYTLDLKTPYGVENLPGNWWHVKKYKGSSDPNGVQFFYDVYAKMTIDGKKVYCVEPNTMAIAGASDYSKISFGDRGFSPEVEERLRYIVTFGYGWDGDTSEYMDWATQIAIWNTIDPGNIYNVHKDIQKKIDEIMSRVDIMYTLVSFRNTTLTFNGLGESNKKTITDENGVFKYYLENTVPEGVVTKQDGNNLTVWVTKPITGEGVKVKYDAFYLEEKASPDAPSLAYDSGSSQDVAYIPAYPDPISTRLTVKTNLVKPLTIGKQDEDKNWVPNTAFHVAYGSDMSQLLVNPKSTNPDDPYEFKTGSDGKVTVPSAYIQGDKIYGIEKTTVYVQEVGVPEHLVLSKTIHTVNLKRVSEEGSNSFNAENRWVRGKIKIVLLGDQQDCVLSVFNCNSDKRYFTRY